jgi:RND family efflux transporter MFP subunit
MKKSMIPAAALLLLAACHPATDPSGRNSSEEVRVTTTPVKMEKVTTLLRYSGTVEAIQTIPLSFATTGTVESVLVNEGDAVRKGQLLASLDKNDARNMYSITQSQYQQAKDAYDRMKSVHESGSLPDIKWVEMESKLEQARSSLEIAKNNLSKCDLFAPVDGTVGRRNIEPGMSSITITSSPLELVDLREVYIKISVPENEVALIAKGAKAQFMVSALGGKPFEGSVTLISPVADRISRTYEARIRVANPGQELKPGMVCDVSMRQNVEKELVMIPYQCISKDLANAPYVFLVNPGDKRVTRKNITTGQYHDDGVEVLSGLQPGQIIVYGGKEKLSDNAVIRY